MPHRKTVFAYVLLQICISCCAHAMPADNLLDPVGYDIDHVVDVTLSSMTKAARDRHTTTGDKPVDRKYSSEARKMLLSDIAFKKELAKVLLEVDKAARDAINPPEFPGTPIVSTSAEEGVSDGFLSVSADSGERTRSVNTRPCVCAGVRGIHDAALDSYPEVKKDQLLMRRYEHNFSAVLRSNGLFDRLLSEACGSLIELANKTAEAHVPGGVVRPPIN
jgi:hypothetical protein